MDLSTPISFEDSYKLADIEELSEKKQISIVIAMITLKIMSRMV